MMNRSNTTTLRKDPLLISGILLRLALPRLLTRLTVILATIALVVYCSKGILTSGKAWLDFAIKVSGLSEILGKAVIDFIALYQKYFWWLVILILSLIALNCLLSYLRNSLKRGRATLIPLGDVRQLCARLSPEGLDVLVWVWKDQSQPITVGILQTTAMQINSGRVRKLALARAHQTELTTALRSRPLEGVPTTPPPHNGVLPPANDSGQREPTLLA